MKEPFVNERNFARREKFAIEGCRGSAGTSFVAWACGAEAISNLEIVMQMSVTRAPESEDRVALGPEYEREMNNIRAQRVALVRKHLALLEKIDPSNKTAWTVIIQLAGGAGVTDDDLQRQLGASATTLWRWKSGEGAPRENIRPLLKSALVELARSHVQDLEKSSGEPTKVTGSTRRFAGGPNLRRQAAS